MRIERRSYHSVRIISAAIEQAEFAATANLPRETGGIILGWRTNGDISAIQCIEVTDKEAGTSSYCRLHVPAEAALREVLASEPDSSPLGYVGEWHTHTEPYNASSQDIKELGSIARGASGSIALMVLTYNPSGAFWAHYAWIAIKRYGRRPKCYPSPIIIKEGGNENTHAKC